MPVEAIAEPIQARYFSENDELVFEERYIFKRLYKNGQSFMWNSQNYLVIRSELVGNNYDVIIREVDSPVFED